MKIRKATLDDIAEISAFLEKLAALGKRNLPSDPTYVRTQYVSHPDTLLCGVAEEDDGRLLGLQILKFASKDNIYGVSEGWGIIGTHINPIAARRGVGRALFGATHKAAKAAGLHKIGATIGASNAEGLAYYDALGFVTYKSLDGRLCKCFDVTA